MIEKKPFNETSFQVLSHSFSVSPSTYEYTLQYSADGVNWTNYPEPIPAEETLIVNGCAFGQYINLDGFLPYNDESTWTLIY